MARNYSAEYARRLALGRERGETRQQARGHRTTPERPLEALRQPERYEGYIEDRTDFLEALAETPLGRRALARLNERRAAQNKGPIVIGPPPAGSPMLRLTTFTSLAEAEPHGVGIPPPYHTYYLHRGGVTLAIQRAERKSRRRAA